MKIQVIKIALFLKIVSVSHQFFAFFTDRSSYSEKVVLNNNTSLAKKEDISENEPLVRVNDRIVWLSDDGPEYGVVKWIGVLPDADVQEVVAGIEFVSTYINPYHAREFRKLFGKNCIFEKKCIESQFSREIVLL